MPGAALREVGALVGAPLRVAGRSAGWSAAPDSSPERYSERRSEIFRSANALMVTYLFRLFRLLFFCPRYMKRKSLEK